MAPTFLTHIISAIGGVIIVLCLLIQILFYFKYLDQTEELSAMDINFIEMEQSLRKQLKEDQKQTMNTIQSLCKLRHCHFRKC